MRTISSTLLAAQRQPSAAPHISVQASTRIDGLPRLDWQRLYSGQEEPYLHGLAMAADGSLVRVRLTPPSDGRRMYRQRVSSPGPTSDFGSWTDTGQYDCVAVAAAAGTSEISLVWINAGRELCRITSTDCGVTWGPTELVDYSPTTAVNGLAASYKPNGDVAIFFADQALLYVKKRIGGTWQAASPWDKTTGDLSGVSAIFASDWDLLVTGRDSSGQMKLWSLVHGDGNQLGVGLWSDLAEVATAPASGEFQYRCPFIDNPDALRCFFVEAFTGPSPYARPYWSHSVSGAPLEDALWREPVPFNVASEYGLALAHHGDYAWLSAPNGVWRSQLSIQQLDLTRDVLALEIQQQSQAHIHVEIRNDDGRYSQLPDTLAIGCQISVSPGFVTAVGTETSAGQTYAVEAHEHRSAGGSATLVLEAFDAWRRLETWIARCQYRWNGATPEKSVKEIVRFVLGRVGIGLAAKSESSMITAFFPDFTISPGNTGDAIVNRLLSFVPDLLFIEGDTAYLVNPLTSDQSVYSYGTEHQVFRATYGSMATLVQARLEGQASGEPILLDVFDWPGIETLYDRLKVIQDLNLDTVDHARERGGAVLRKARVSSEYGELQAPVNSGLQPLDVIDVTDRPAGLTAVKKRVSAIRLLYEPSKGRYLHHLTLEGV